MREKLLRVGSTSLSCVRKIFANGNNYKSGTVDEFSSIAQSVGYRSESHEVETDDGYVLRLHRLLPTKGSVHKGSTFLMHGLFRNSSDFLSSGSQVALAYYLADNGYDVWLGNARGTKFCTQHVKHSYKSREFWKFSFHEIGLHDVSAMLNFLLQQTKETQTRYIGHSQGASSLLALLSSSPSFNQKIAQAHLLTPAVFMKHSTSPLLTLRLLHSKMIQVDKLKRPTNRHSSSPPRVFSQKAAKTISTVDISFPLTFSRLLCNFNGYDRATALRLYKGFTCSLVGKNVEETQISEVSSRISLLRV
jgi:pimeloyl-ACP methyl ester carboxylesterase